MTLFAVAAIGLQVIFSERPLWRWFKTSVAAFLCSLSLTAILIGDELNWLTLDNETLDDFSMVWVVVTLVIAGLTFWMTGETTRDKREAD